MLSIPSIPYNFAQNQVQNPGNAGTLCLLIPGFASSTPMSDSPSKIIPMRANAPAKPTAPQEAPPSHWQWRTVMAAPHRLGFLMAMVVLAIASAWWAAAQLDLAMGRFDLSYKVGSVVLHAAVMVFGFMPLYFSGFLFTAGPKWLHVQPPTTADTRPAVLLQTGGWLLWLLGGHIHVWLAAAGATLAFLGLTRMYGMWWKMIRASKLQDRIHATTVGVAGLVGCISLAGLIVAVLLSNTSLALTWVRTSLWGFIVLTFVVVAHRMIPFFTSNAVPLVKAWRPFWVLWLMLGAAAFEVLCAWITWFGLQGSGWMVVRGAVELAAGGLLLWLAVVWGVAQSLKIRLLAMLHVGFVWLGLSFVISALSMLLGASQGQPMFSLGTLHALTMGCLGSLILAMVTRVSCGHSGRKLVADNTVWTLFWLLQLAVLLRLAGALAINVWLVPAAALLWLGIVTIWGWRYSQWYGRPRMDGKAG